MSIDYFGHSSRDVADAKRRTDYAHAAHPDWFGDILILYEPHAPRKPFDAQISREFGIEAKSWFMLSVNDKERFSDCLNDALEFLYRLFGTDELVITHGLDSIRPPLGPYKAMPLP